MTYYQLKMKKFLTAIFGLLVMHLGAQNFSGGGGSITDNQQPSFFPITIQGIANRIDSAFGIQQICFNISHARANDLEIKLEAPDGSIITLASRLGNPTSQNFSSTCFRGSSPNSIRTAIAPFTGTFRPFEMLGAFNNGQNPNGTWKLWVTDLVTGVAGSVSNWTLSFSGTSPAIPELPFSNLPIIKINTGGQTIVDEPKRRVTMEFVMDTTGGNTYPYRSVSKFKGTIGIEFRGSSSQGFPKKSYGFETWDVTLNDSDVAFPGFPAESDWILNANYTDKSLLRNVFTYDMARKMGWYAPRTQFVELIIDDKYQGIYILMEKIKKNNARVDIATLNATDTSAIEITGGYIFKIDKTTGSGSGNGWNSNFRSPSSNKVISFQPEYPDADSITPLQKQYLIRYVDSFERALAGPNFMDTALGWRKFANEASFIDYFLLNELAKNVDGLRISTYLHKHKITNKKGKIVMGPVWDYDIAYRNADYCGGDNLTGWAYNFNLVCGNDGMQVPFWWSRLVQDTAFTTHLRCRYDRLRSGYWSNASLNRWVDSMATLLNPSKTRNFNKWPILGIYVWPNPSPIPSTYAGEIANFKSNLSNRLNWLDANIPGQCWGIPLNNEEEKAEPAQIYPNPANEQILVVLSKSINQMEWFNLAGQKIMTIPTQGALQFSVSTAQLPNGIYWLKMGTEVRKVVVQH